MKNTIRKITKIVVVACLPFSVWSAGAGNTLNIQADIPSAVSIDILNAAPAVHNFSTGLSQTINSIVCLESSASSKLVGVTASSATGVTSFKVKNGVSGTAIPYTPMLNGITLVHGVATNVMGTLAALPNCSGASLHPYKVMITYALAGTEPAGSYTDVITMIASVAV